HQHVLADGQLLEVAKIVGQVPWHLSVLADGRIIVEGSNHRNGHARSFTPGWHAAYRHAGIHLHYRRKARSPECPDGLYRHRALDGRLRVIAFDGNVFEAEIEDRAHVRVQSQ